MEKKYPIGVEPNTSSHQDIIVKVCKAQGVKSLELTTKHIALMSDCISEYIAQQAPTGAVWVKASERLPENCGKDNTVVVRGKWEGKWPFVTYGFRNYNEEDPRMYYEVGSKSECNNDIEWLDESGTAALNPDELWDEFSEYPKDIDSCLEFAGSAVMTREGFMKMIERMKK